MLDAGASIGAAAGAVVGALVGFSPVAAAVRNTFAADWVISPLSSGRCETAVVHAAIKLNNTTQRRIVMPIPR